MSLRNGLLEPDSCFPFLFFFLSLIYPSILFTVWKFVPGCVYFEPWSWHSDSSRRTRRVLEVFPFLWGSPFPRKFNQCFPSQRSGWNWEKSRVSPLFSVRALTTSPSMSQRGYVIFNFKFGVRDAVGCLTHKRLPQGDSTRSGPNLLF